MIHVQLAVQSADPPERGGWGGVERTGGSVVKRGAEISLRVTQIRTGMLNICELTAPPVSAKKIDKEQE